MCKVAGEEYETRKRKGEQQRATSSNRGRDELQIPSMDRSGSRNRNEMEEQKRGLEEGQENKEEIGRRRTQSLKRAK